MQKSSYNLRIRASTAPQYRIETGIFRQKRHSISKVPAGDIVANRCRLLLSHIILPPYNVHCHRYYQLREQHRRPLLGSQLCSSMPYVTWSAVRAACPCLFSNYTIFPELDRFYESSGPKREAKMMRISWCGRTFVSDLKETCPSAQSSFLIWSVTAWVGASGDFNRC